MTRNKIQQLIKKTVGGGEHKDWFIELEDGILLMILDTEKKTRNKYMNSPAYILGSIEMSRRQAVADWNEKTAKYTTKGFAQYIPSTIKYTRKQLVKEADAKPRTKPLHSDTDTSHD